MIKGIIFDLGYTLLRFADEWDTVLQQGLEEMTTWYFKKKRIRMDAPALQEAFHSERVAARQKAEETQIEVTAQESLRNALDKIEAPASAKALLEQAVKIYFGPEEAAWQCYPDAIDTLKLLHGQDYRLGLYSNASDDALIQRLVNRNRLRPLLSPTFSSAGCRWRKPRPETFELIANRWGLPPDEIVVVGDTLKADILGAQNTGMSSILVTMNEAPTNADHRHIQPTAVAERLSDLPEIITHLS